ncbi:MAG: M14 family metallopeptidase [Xanthomonadales bacterium]|nr:M14 family metallopeptidase [Xanthomonadales bacterium]
MRHSTIAALLLSTAFPLASSASSGDLATVSERSGFLRTGRYDEVIRLCRDFQAKYPKAVRCFDFGTTPEGRPMKAMAVSTSGALTPEAARAKGLPVVLAQGGIHAGEIDGKDAGFLAIREMLQGKAAKGALDRVVLLFVPVFNVDGHENFRAWNRPNQRGPEEMGFRVTAQRYNLNRDYMKADAPEMQALLRLDNAWDPLVEIDLHVTDGAKFQHDVSITGEPVNSGDMELRSVGRAVKDGLLERLAAQGSQPLGFYPSFVEDDDPESGFIEGPSTPRFSNGYYQLRNRVGILLETHSWRTYPERVRITRNGIVDLVELTAAHGKDWLAAARAADQRARKLAGTPVALSYRTTDDVRMIDFKGYAYERRKSDISGGTMTEYDESKPQVWHVPLKDHVVADAEVVAPRAGYLIPAAWAAIVEPKLKVHGIEYRRLAKALPGAAVETFRADTAKFAANSFEGHQPVTLTGHWAPEHRDLVAGALFVPIAQAKSRLLMGLLEPQAPDALVAWGEMNNAFESKEYMESYVAEQEARKMLARDPALKQEFEQRLKNDGDFAKSPRARLDFFYRRHPAHDQALRLYPVYRSDTTP